MSTRSDFSLVRGGPFYRLLRASGLARGDRFDGLRQSLAAISLTWGPIMLLGLIDPPGGDGPNPLSSLALHARLLVTIPCLLFAEGSIHMRTARCIGRFVDGRWAPRQDAAIAKIVASVERMRDALLPEAILLALAIGASQAVLWGLADPLATRETGLHVARSPAVFWLALVALPLYHFLGLRWLWRWGLWALLLFRLSRLEIRPIATHPDRQGGMGFVSEPSVGLAWVVFGQSAVIAGAWATRILYAGAQLESFIAHAVLLVAIALAVGFAPVLCFSDRLWRARFDALRSYGGLATDYTRRFQRRWIDRGDEGELLGTPDIQSLADLANSYDVLTAMRITPIARRSVLILATAAIAPLALLIFTRLPLMALLQELGETWLGRIHG